MTGSDELLLLRALLRASDYGALLSDARRRDLVCNRRFCEMFGLGESETLGLHPDQVRALVLPRVQDPAEFVRVLDAVYADPRLTREDEVELIAPRPRLLRRYTAPVLDEQENVIGRLWTFLDITRTRRLEDKVKRQAEQLKAQARQLAAALKIMTGRLDKVETTLSLTQQQLFESEKLSAVGLLAASIAHDIRNILTPLTIELTLADEDDAGARAEALALTRRQVDRLALLTRRLLALAKPSASECSPVAIGPLLQRIVELLRGQAAGENVSLLIRCPSHLPPILGDAAQIDQVLVNLALNGLQAMRATNGGTLSLSATRRSADGREGVQVSVADTGEGIARAARRRLFDPFFTTRPDGAGLGLFSCRRILEAHGGTIRVQSVPGRGTRFSLWLPCARQEKYGEARHGW